MKVILARGLPVQRMRVVYTGNESWQVVFLSNQ